MAAHLIERTQGLQPFNHAEMNARDSSAIDVHAHIESDEINDAVNQAAKKYFGDWGVDRDRRALAE